MDLSVPSQPLFTLRYAPPCPRPPSPCACLWLQDLQRSGQCTQGASLSLSSQPLSATIILTVSMNFTYSRYLMYMVSYNIFMTTLFYLWDSPVAQTVKRMPAMRETQVQSLDREDPWRKKWQPTPVLLPRNFHGWRSLVSYSTWGRKESDMTERLHFHFLYFT